MPTMSGPHRTNSHSHALPCPPQFHGSHRAAGVLCCRTGCGQPSWNGRGGHYCTKACRDADSSSGSNWLDAIASAATAAVSGISSFCLTDMKPQVSPNVIPFWPHPSLGLPRNNNYYVAFYFPGRAEPCDELCKAGFLGNFYDLDTHGSHRVLLEPFKFRTAEGAYHAQKCWGRASEFQDLDGNASLKFSRSLSSKYYPDGGFCSWKAMQAVLRSKFKRGTQMAQLLLQTGQSLLLEHNSVPGRDQTWSDNSDGFGRNWLGMLLMLRRDELAGQNANSNRWTWTAYLNNMFHLENGSPKHSALEAQWRNLVWDASDNLRQCLLQGRIVS